jgi:ribose 5-phosphate isomerase B
MDICMKVIDEHQIRLAYKNGQQILKIAKDTLVTPSAVDAAKSLGIVLQNQKEGVHGRLVGQVNINNTENKRVAIGSDHGGFALKEKLKPYLHELNYEVRDFGCFSEKSVDYPDYARVVAESVSKGEALRGIMIDGAGIGSCMVANKVPGIRAAMCYDLKSAVNSREHNNANVLTLGGLSLDSSLATEIVKVWLETPFGGDRHQRRVDKIMTTEKDYSKTR